MPRERGIVVLVQDLQDESRRVRRDEEATLLVQDVRTILAYAPNTGVIVRYIESDLSFVSRHFQFRVT